MVQTIDTRRKALQLNEAQSRKKKVKMPKCASKNDKNGKWYKPMIRLERQYIKMRPKVDKKT